MQLKLKEKKKKKDAVLYVRIKSKNKEILEKMAKDRDISTSEFIDDVLDQITNNKEI